MEVPAICSRQHHCDFGSFAAAVLRSISQIPSGVRVDSVSVDISKLTFGSSLRLIAPSPEESEEA